MSATRKQIRGHGLCAHSPVRHGRMAHIPLTISQHYRLLCLPIIYSMNKLIPYKNGNLVESKTGHEF